MCSDNSRAIFSLCRTPEDSGPAPKGILLGVPYDRACSYRTGTALAPDHMRELSHVLPPYTDQGKEILRGRVIDLGNVIFGTNISSLSIDDAFQVMKKEIDELLNPYSFLIAETGCPLFTIGGDHSITVAILEWLNRHFTPSQKIKVVYLDAHPDLCDNFDNSFYSHACVFRRILDLTRVTPRDLLGIGVRSFEEQEISFLRRWPEVCVTAADAFSCKWEDMISRIMKFIAQDPFYLSVDIDVLDPSAAPGTGVCEAGGLDSRQVMELIKSLSSKSNMIGMDIVEVSPPLDCSDITSFAALKFLFECFPKRE